MLNGWSVNPDATGAGYVAPDPTHSTATTAHGKVGAGSDSSIDQSAQDAPPLFSRSPADISPQVDAARAGAPGVGGT